MNRQRFIVLLVAALLAISGALYLSTQRNLPRDPHGMALLPTLASELNSVSALTVRKGAAAPVTVHKQGEQWTVAERADYPAEDGETYLDNARIKARFAWEPGLWALGEDSGIEVAALGGAPGLRSARSAQGDEVGGAQLRQVAGSTKLHSYL